MEKEFFHHALRILKDVCIGCSHCMRVCPTEALRVIDGKAELIEDLPGHRRLPDKKTVKQSSAMLEQHEARYKRRTQMRFGLIRALTGVIELNFSLNAGTDIFEPGQDIQVVFAA